MRSGSSRAVSPVAGHGVEKGRRVPYRPSPDRVRYDLIVRRRIACRRARRRIAYHHIAVRFGDLGVSAMPPVWHPEGSSSAMSRPNSACSRRRHRRFTNIYSFTWPWRSIVARSAARLRRTVGPLPVINALAGQQLNHNQIFLL